MVSVVLSAGRRRGGRHCCCCLATAPAVSEGERPTPASPSLHPVHSWEEEGGERGEGEGGGGGRGEERRGEGGGGFACIYEDPD